MRSARDFGNHVWALIAETFVRFEADGVPRLAAAMAYFLLLTVAPLLLIVNAILGLVGANIEQLAGGQAVAGAAPSASAGFTQAVSWAGSWAPYLAVGLVVVSAISVFGQFTGALAVIWDTPPRLAPVRAFLRYQALSLVLLVVAASALLLALLLASVASILAGTALDYARAAGLQLSGVWVALALRILPVALAAWLLFWVAFTVAPDRRIRWRDSLMGSLVTTALFLGGEQVLAYYLGSTERFNVFGTFQFFVVLIVWIYYSALVALWGAELTRLLILEAEASRDLHAIGTLTSPVT